MRGAYYPQMTETVNGEYTLKNQFGNVISRGEFRAPADGLSFDAQRATYIPALGEVREQDALIHVWSA